MKVIVPLLQGKGGLSLRARYLGRWEGQSQGPATPQTLWLQARFRRRGAHLSGELPSSVARERLEQHSKASNGFVGQSLEILLHAEDLIPFPVVRASVCYHVSNAFGEIMTGDGKAFTQDVQLEPEALFG
jgi:hypothetical protein